MTNLNKEFWENRYQTNDTGWDIGTISMPLKAYIDQLTNKEINILIPGAGNSHEAEYLYLNGFKNVFVIDIAAQPLNNLKKRVPNFPENQLIQKNFFDLNQQFDLILEQTFFCALRPSLRPKYASKMNDLLKNEGKLVGLLFDFPLTEEGPPFGGNKKEYSNHFSKNFKIKVLEICKNSINPRKGKELFIIFEKKQA